MWIRRPRTMATTMLAVLSLGLAVGAGRAQEPPLVEPPVLVDPAVCQPVRSGAFLPLGSARLAVIGVEPESGACIVELFSETEGGYTQRICRFAADADAFTYVPRAFHRDEDAPAWYGDVRPFCEVVDSGNFLMPGAEPVVFPRTPWLEARNMNDDSADAPAEAPPDDRSDDTTD